MGIFSMDNEDGLMPSERVLNAASFGQAEDLRAALAAGGDPNYIRLDIAPTLTTVMRGYIPCLELLVGAGGRSDLPNRYGWTAVHEAAQQEDGQALAIIMGAPDHVSLRVKDNNGETALRAAMDKDQFANATALWGAEPDLLNMSDDTGRTPTMWAIENKRADWLEWCLRRGADLTRTNDQNQTTLEQAAAWDEGKALIETVAATEVPDVVPQAPRAVEQEAAEPTAPAVPANPFGLGIAKKRNGP